MAFTEVDRKTLTVAQVVEAPTPTPPADMVSQMIPMMMMVMMMGMIVPMMEKD